MLLKTTDGQIQEKRLTGELTGFVDCNLTPIRVGDRMIIKHWCNCPFCTQSYRCRVEWNEEWKAYGLRDEKGIWQSGMGIVSGYTANPWE